MCLSVLFVFFNATPTTEIYTLSLHDALPICRRSCSSIRRSWRNCTASSCTPAPTSSRHSRTTPIARSWPRSGARRSEEHTSELQSHSDLVCRLLLEKKNTNELSKQTQDPASA